MSKPWHFATAVSTVVFTLTIGSVSESSQSRLSPNLTPKLATAKLSSTPPSEQCQDAINKTRDAATITQSKKNQSLVINRWQTASYLLKTIHKISPNYTKAQNEITQYQHQLADEQQISQAFSKQKIDIASALKENPLTKISQQTNASGISTIALANHLKKIGAKFYGAFWCPYCTRQKQMFGEQAFRQINYIECDPRGNNPRPDLCRKASIRGFPTWEIKGKQYPGMKSLQELADLSGYKGNRNFGN